VRSAIEFGRFSLILLIVESLRLLGERLQQEQVPLLQVHSL
jgi:hypothetical protein